MQTRHAVALAILALALAPATGRAQPVDSTSPPGLHWESVAWDEAGRRLVLVGGGTAGGYLAGTWAWDGARWTVIADSASSPSPRHAHAMAYHPLRRRVVLYGGGWEGRDQTIPLADRMVSRCDTWELDGARWRRLADGPCAGVRTGATALVWDDRVRALLLVEGPPAPPLDTALRPLRLWRFDGDRWTLVDSAGPRRLSSGGVARDARRGVLVVPVFDGPDAGTWEWGARGWRRLPLEGPAPRRSHAMAWDPRLGRVVLRGGLALGERRPLDDAWSWDGRAWATLPARTPAPGPRSHATLLLDARERRLLLFGGAGPRGLIRELWIEDAYGWREWRAGEAARDR